MTRYIVFTNTGNTITAIPLGQLSKTEKSLILSSGGQIKTENELSGNEKFPRDGKPQGKGNNGHVTSNRE